MSEAPTTRVIEVEIKNKCCATPTKDGTCVRKVLLHCLYPTGLIEN